MVGAQLLSLFGIGIAEAAAAARVGVPLREGPERGMEHNVWRYTARQSRDVSSDAKRVGSTGLAFDIRREVAPLVSKIARPVVAVKGTRIGDVHNAPRCGCCGVPNAGRATRTSWSAGAAVKGHDARLLRLVQRYRHRNRRRGSCGGGAYRMANGPDTAAA